MKKTFPLLILGLIVFVGFLIFSGQTNDEPKAEKWSIDPRSTKLYQNPVAQYAPEPVINENIIRTFTKPMIYNTNAGIVMVNPNKRVHPSTTTQSEVPIVRHPTNPLILYASSNAARLTGSTLQFLSEGMYISTDGGLTWSGSDTTAAAPLSNHGGDPAPIIGPNGYFYQSYLGYTTDGMFASYSTNNGLTWANTYTITSGSQDKNHGFVNDVAASPYYGRVYVTWSLFTLSAPPCVVAYSTNNGTSYSSYITVSTPLSGHYHQGVNGAIMPNGDAVICWQSPTTSSPYTGDYVGFAKSTNGGVTWTANNNIYDCNGIRGTLTNKAGIRVNDFPWMGIDRTAGPRQGWIYIVTAEKNLSPAGSDPDIILHKSTDGGTTWSSGVRVNQDGLNNGKTQYMPALRVDEYGGVNIIYYDDRNTSTDSAEVYVSRSIDGGVNWTDILVSDHRFKPKSILGLATGYQGDYIGITSGNNKIYPYWCDDITGIYQAWITTIDLGPSISHTPLTNTEQTTGTRQVLAQITPAGSGIVPSQTKLFFTKNPSFFTDSVIMTNSGGTNWTANITLSGTGIYRYYIKTRDSINRVATAPGGAPANYYSFSALPDTVKPVITHTPLTDVPKVNWPVSVGATVTDNIGIDSVWVRWYRNMTGNGIKHFKLLPQSGNTYSAAFNSVQADVQVGDVIYYKIFAIDNSTNHNTDSSSLYNFNITSQVTVCVGSGATAVGWPFYTYYMDSRTDMLYLASELGLSESGYIQKIGFTVVTAATQEMNGFTVKMQNTTATSITAFTNSGWTIAYNGTYTVPGTGLQYIELQTPFYYEQGKNLLIEICFNNSSWTSNTTVYGTAATNRNKHQHSDLTSGDGCSEITTPGTTYTALPNICVVINPVEQNLTLNLKAYLEGFWNGANMVSDTAKVYLANSTSPYAFVDSQKVVLSAAGTANVTFTNVSSGSYYIVIKHRNHLETWSTLPQTMNLGTTVSYDFTTAQTQGYGNNLIYSNGAWCIYGGDINQDGFVDGADMAILDNDLYNYVSGYVMADVNGDQFVDGADMAILDNNLYNYIGVVRPGGKDAIRKNILLNTKQERNKTIWDVKETKEQENKVIRKHDDKVTR